MFILRNASLEAQKMNVIAVMAKTMAQWEFNLLGEAVVKDAECIGYSDSTIRECVSLVFITIYKTFHEIRNRQPLL